MCAQSAKSNERTSSHELKRQINLYSLAAAAAGVGMLALAAPAEGEVVVTRKTIQIPLSSLGVEGVGISFAYNGVDDVKLILSSFSIFGANGNALKAVNSAQGEGVLGHNVDRVSWASALAASAKIGPSANFVSAPGCGGTYFSYCGVRLAATHTSTFGSRGVGGPFAGDPKTAFLGVRFLIDGETHYGWVRLTVNTSMRRRTMAKVTAYAYETAPEKPIWAGSLREAANEAPVPKNIQTQAGPSLGMLSLGAPGLLLWRTGNTFESEAEKAASEHQP